MPIYEYQCQACGEETEVLQKISDAPLKECPACGKAALKKKVSAAAFRLKGGGWYETDFKTGDKRNLAGGDKAAGDKAGEGGGKSDAARPAADKSAGDKSSGDKSSGAKKSGGKSETTGAA